jgi:hypothetical protein
MAVRERIEAMLKVKDVARFKGGMKTAAKAVKEFGHDAEATAAQLALLRSIDKRLEHQTEALAASMVVAKHEVNDLGDEAVKTAAKVGVLSRTMGLVPNVVKKNLTSWRFWKDRLSLTRSEILTTALTLGLYLAPALISVGSSAAAAAIGGGAVAGGGIASLIFGLVTLGTVAKKASDQISKIQKAQDAYTLAVQQFGKGSAEAARSAGHLYAVIQTQGGKPVWEAQRALAKLKKTWGDLTLGARFQMFRTLTEGAKSFQRVIPTIATETNKMARSLHSSLTQAFAAISGPESQGIFKTLGETFRGMSGPAIRGFTNLWFVLGRIFKAVSPWVIRTAKAFEHMTMSWRRGTRDGGKVKNTVDDLVGNFKAWWGLIKAVGRTLGIVFSATHDKGRDLVLRVTALVNKFNDWLQMFKDTGQFDRWYSKYLEQLNKLKDFISLALTDPGKAFDHGVDVLMKALMRGIDRWMPAIMDAIARAFVTHAPHVASSFLGAFFAASAWAKFLTVTFLLGRFGAFKALGGAVGTKFAGPFVRNFLIAAFPRLTAAFAAEGALGIAFASWGTTAGKVFSAAFARAFLPVAIALGLYEAGKSIPGTVGSIKHGGESALESFKKRVQRGLGKAGVGKQAGGTIPWGTQSIVGESGPELATAGVSGLHISPMSVPSGRAAPIQPMSVNAMSVSDFMPPVHVHVNVERREIAKAVADFNDYRRARRGER